jgi:hypothetical protein
MATPVEDFVTGSMEALRLQSEGNASIWGLGSDERWDADLDTGRIAFTFSNGTVATANLQIVGTYDTADGTFLWGWDHPSVPEPLSKHAELAHVWGTENRVEDFTVRKVSCTERRAWEFAAVASRLGGASGVYRGPSGSALVFMTFGTVRLSPAPGGN